jgi:hypothetical protein
MFLFFLDHILNKLGQDGGGVLLVIIYLYLTGGIF